MSGTEDDITLNKNEFSSSSATYNKAWNVCKIFYYNTKLRVERFVVFYFQEEMAEYK